MTTPVYKGALVHVEITQLIDAEVVAKFAEHKDVGIDRMAHKLAKMLARHLATATTQADGSVLLKLAVPLMLAPGAVPPGMAHTRILFTTEKEAAHAN